MQPIVIVSEVCPSVCLFTVNIFFVVIVLKFGLNVVYEVVHVRKAYFIKILIANLSNLEFLQINLCERFLPDLRTRFC